MATWSDRIHTCDCATWEFCSWWKRGGFRGEEGGVYDRVYLVVQHLGTAHLREKMGLKISRNPYRMKSDATLPKQRAVLWTVMMCHHQSTVATDSKKPGNPISFR